MENAVTKVRKISYGLYFYGDRILWTDRIYDYIFTDIGITAALVCDRGADHERCGMPSTIRSSV